MGNKITLFSLILIAVLSSCGVPRNIAYFEGIDDKSTLQSVTQNAENYTTYIVPGDMLSITVSSENPTATAIFNIPALSYLTPGEKTIYSSPQQQTYLVGTDGCIEFPVLGSIRVGGLTRKEASDMIAKLISKKVDDPIVTIQVLNFHVTVMGEVTRPGVFPITSERVTLLEALGYANDMTIYGDRTNVLVIREQNGKRELKRIDLTSADLFSSPYYYLQQNDVVYVEPNKARKGNSKYSQNAQYNLSVISTIVSTVSVIMTLILAISK